MNIREFRDKSSVDQKIIYSVYVIAFLIATSTHLRDIVTGGLLPYRTQPLWANVYWTALTVADPVAIIILFINLRTGMKIYACIIISDVIINLYFTVSASGLAGILNFFMLTQIFFLIFLAFTWRRMYDKRY